MFNSQNLYTNLVWQNDLANVCIAIFYAIIRTMSKKEEIKIKIDIMKGIMFALLTALFGIFAFVVVNIESINTFQAVACVLGVIAIAIFFWILIRYLLKNLKKLRKIK
ncbi:hypothetical protein [Helicobacter sp. 23-1045]